MSLYAEYLKEREQVDTFETEFGFISYQIREKEVFIKDMYVRPENRGGANFALLINKVCSIAKAHGIKFVTATVQCADRGCVRNLKAAFKLDFFILRAENNCIVLARELGE